jgi:hypothetical protein
VRIGRPSRTSATLAVGLTLALALSPAARAGHDPDPIAQGLALRKAGDDQGALPLFQKGYEATHAPRAAAQLGLCEQALGRWLDAETHVTEALKAADDPWVKKNDETLYAALVVIKSHVGRLEIVGTPAGATVTVNGLEVGPLPLAEPIRVAAGEVEVALTLPGYVRASRSVRVDGAGYQKIALHAEREAVPAPAAVATPAEPAAEPAAATTPTAVATVTEHPAEESQAGGGWRKPVRWTALGLGAVSLGVGIYGILHNRSLVDQFDDGCGIDGKTGVAHPKTGSTETDMTCGDLKQRYETASTIGTVGLVSAGIFAAAGVVLWLTEPEPGPVQAALRSCGLGVGAGRLSLGCGVRF